MVLESDTGRCASENARTPKGVNCEISHCLERRTEHSLYEYENLSLVDAF